MFSPVTTHRLTQATLLVNTAAGAHGGQALPERLDAVQLTAILSIPTDAASATRSDARSATADGTRRQGAAGEDIEAPSEGALRSVRKLRSAVAGIWHDAAAQDPEAALSGINHLLAAAGPVHLSLPGDPDGGGSGTAATARHTAAGPASGSAARTPAVLAAGREGDPLDRVLATGLALALTDVALAGELTRLSTCSGEDCENAFVDLTRNRSKQFCDEANCANRAHVRAYRARRSAEAEAADGSDGDATAGRPDQSTPEMTAEKTAEKANGPEKKAEKKSDKKAKSKKKSKKDKKK